MNDDLQIKINKQEYRDFEITTDILGNIFKSYDCIIETAPTPQNYVYDMTLTVITKNKIKKYGIEIKEFTDFKQYDNTLIKFDKLNRIKKQAEEDKVIPMYMNYSIKSNTYYLYDLSKLVIEDKWVVNLTQKKSEFAQYRGTDTYPTVFIPHHKATIIGNIYEYDTNQ